MRLISLCFLFLFIGSSALAVDIDQLIAKPGLKVEKRTYKKLFGGRQRIHIAYINLNKMVVRPIMPGSGCLKLSKMAQNENAVLAVNGTFFSKQCDSEGLLKISGVIHAYNTIRRNGAASLLINKKASARVKIVNSTENPSNTYHAIGGFPRLVLGSRVRIRPIEKTDFFDKKHPRTAVGITSSRTLILVTVDGRSRSSKGMTIYELADYMKRLGARAAINLDGGGSTTMWSTDRGVLNSPSDWWGQRAVANGLAVFN